VLYGLTTLGRNDQARALRAPRGHHDAASKAALRLHDDARVLQLTKNEGGGAPAALVPP